MFKLFLPEGLPLTSKINHSWDSKMQVTMFLFPLFCQVLCYQNVGVDLICKTSSHVFTVDAGVHWSKKSLGCICGS